MAGAPVSSPCGYCGTAVAPGQTTCPHCGIHLIDITRHHWGYDAKEAVLEAVDRAGDKARAVLGTPEGRRAVTLVGLATGLASSALVGWRLLRKRRA
jgi:hypothetical protein